MRTLKTGKVYIHKEEYLLVFGHRMSRSRRLYTVQAVAPNGTVSLNTKEVQFRVGQFKETKIKIKIVATVRGGDKATMRFYASLRECRKRLEELATYKTNQNLRSVGRSVIAMLGCHDTKTNKIADLRYLSQKLGFKSAAKFYALITKFYAATCTPDKYTHALKEAADNTLLDSYTQYQTMWSLIHGFSKKLDVILEKDLKGYVAEINFRGL